MICCPMHSLFFCFKVTTATVEKPCSAMGFILAGLVNDIVTVSVSSHVFGDVITGTQYTRIVECLAGVAACSSINFFSWRTCALVTYLHGGPAVLLHIPRMR